MHTRGDSILSLGARLLLKLITVPRRLLSQPRGRTASQPRRSLSQEASAALGTTKRRLHDSGLVTAPDVVPARWAHACQSSSDNKATATSAFSGPARRAAASMQIQEYLLSIFSGQSQEQAPSRTITFPAPSSTVPGTEQVVQSGDTRMTLLTHCHG